MKKKREIGSRRAHLLAPESVVKNHVFFLLYSADPGPEGFDLCWILALPF